jgi:hypothetical protein
MIIGLPLTVSSSGNSASWYLPEGDHTLFFSAAGWGIAALQVSPDDSNWFAARDSAGEVSLTANIALRVSGGNYYRLNVSTYTNPILIKARPSDR